MANLHIMRSSNRAQDRVGQVQPILLKVRSIKGLMGFALSHFGPRLTGDTRPEKYGHFGLQIGNSMYELHCDNDNQKDLLVYELSGAAGEIWASDINELSVGHCDLDDGQIDAVLTAIAAAMNSRGPYDMFRNNCHMFIYDLWERTCTLDNQMKPVWRRDTVPASSSSSSLLPQWFLPKTASVGKTSQPAIPSFVWWIDLFHPLLWTLFTVCSPNNYGHLCRAFALGTVATLAHVTGLDMVANFVVLLRNLCFAIVFVRCAWILYTRKIMMMTRGNGGKEDTEGTGKRVKPEKAVETVQPVAQSQSRISCVTRCTGSDSKKSKKMWSGVDVVLAC